MPLPTSAIVKSKISQDFCVVESFYFIVIHQQDFEQWFGRNCLQYYLSP
jgi:hypothetical protein